LWLADRFSNRWSGPARAALYWVMVVVSIGTVAYYVSDVFWPRQTQPAFPYVIAPPVAWVFSAMVLGAAPLVSRKS
jgi:hypothetical protein